MNRSTMRADRSEIANEELQHHVELLLAEKARLQSELRGRLEILNSGYLAPEDQAPILHEQFVSIRQNNLAYEKLKAIAASLERLKRGEYGICQECDEPISDKRLKAVPWTDYCLTCQENIVADNESRAHRQRLAA